MVNISDQEDTCEEIKKLALKHALINALKHDGKADVRAVVSKVFSERADLRSFKDLVTTLSQEVVKEVNLMGSDEQKILASRLDIHVETKPSMQKKSLPPLPNVESYDKVVVRFAPNPDSAIHLGNARAAILNDEYAKMYDGIYILRFEDTSPSVKPPTPEAYDMVREDLRWLGVEWHREVIQSDRLELYYSYAAKLIELGRAYVCTCHPNVFREYISASKPCPCRLRSQEEHMERWHGMLSGAYKRGEAVVRVKTDVAHPNPAVRDWPALRIDPSPHPRKGGKYRVWPLYNFAAAIDDHELEVSHILRGKEHEINTVRQRYLYAHLGWRYPEVIHYGRLKIEGVMLSKSKIRAGVEDGTYQGWGDPRLGTIIALRRRGFLPDSIRRLMLDVGVRPSEATISWDNLCAINRKLVDPIANRYFFVDEPIRLHVREVPNDFEVKIPYHPNYPERGFRLFKPHSSSLIFFASRKDVELLKPGASLRLMHLFNVRIEKRVDGKELLASFLSADIDDAKRLSLPIIHWVLENDAIPTEVLGPAGLINGFCESECLKLRKDSIVQFVRFGFCRIEQISESMIRAIFAHK